MTYILDYTDIQNRKNKDISMDKLQMKLFLVQEQIFEKNFTIRIS